MEQAVNKLGPVGGVTMKDSNGRLDKSSINAVMKSIFDDQKENL